MALTDKLVAIGDAIREKTGTTDLIPLADMPQAIKDISSGGTEEIEMVQYVTYGRQLFYKATNFPSKATVNIPNIKDTYQAFAYWNTEPIPIVEELTVNAPNIGVSSNQQCMGQMFTFNHGVKKVILNMPDESQYMVSTFANAKNLEEIVLNFSTKNIKNYSQAFGSCNALKRIIGVLDFSSATDISWMFGCSNLEEVRFAPNTVAISISVGCGKISAESVQSIIDGLATVETAQTLTFNANTKILQSQVDSANAKGWTVAGGKVVSEEEYYG